MAFSCTCRRLVGKVAIVTGSSYGIGLAIARRFGREGARVMICSRKSENVERAVDELRSEKLDVRGVVCHVGNAEHRTRLLKETIKTFGQLDILVSNAGVNPHVGNIFESTETQWDKTWDVNVKSPFLLLQEAVPYMEGKWSCVLFISSMAAYDPYELIGAYAVTKAAQLGMVKALVAACAEKKIRVNALAPGLIKTTFSKVMWQNEDVFDRYMNSKIAFKRLGEPEEVANAAAFLASDDARYITGENLVVAGGMASHL